MNTCTQSQRTSPSMCRHSERERKCERTANAENGNFRPVIRYYYGPSRSRLIRGFSQIAIVFSAPVGGVGLRGSDKNWSLDNPE